MSKKVVASVNYFWGSILLETFNITRKRFIKSTEKVFTLPPSFLKLEVLKVCKKVPSILNMDKTVIDVTMKKELTKETSKM